MSLLKLLKDEDLERIHLASVEILAKTGMIFHSQDALGIFKTHGFKVIDKTVFFTKKDVDDALKTCPSTFKWRARKETASVTVGEGVLVQPGGGSVYIQDIEQGRREGRLQDFINIQKLYQSSDVVDMVGFSPVDACDIDQDSKSLDMQFEILKNTDKPIHGHVCGGKRAAEMLEMARIAFGEDDIFETSHIMGLSINPKSPLSIADDQISTLIEYVERNQIILPAPLSIGGVSGPLNPIGITTLVNAETLGVLVLTQLIKPGAPVLPAIGSSFAYMKNAAYCTGTPDQMLHEIINIQLVRDFYHLPTRINAGMCDAKTVDAQAGLETMQNVLMGVLAGCNMIAHTMGVLDAIMTISYEKMIIDEEILKRALYLSKPVNFTEEDLGVQLIGEIGHGGNFIAHDNTLKNCRSVFQPGVSHWGSYEDWFSKGAEDITVRANRAYKERLAAAPDSYLLPEVEKELQDYIRTVR